MVDCYMINVETYTQVEERIYFYEHTRMLHCFWRGAVLRSRVEETHFSSSTCHFYG